MEYQVLARKFRPQRFDQVAGQEHVVRTLANAIAQGRIGQAFLFSGPRGVGKTSVARILAKSLNCEKGPTAIPCNECPNCREITDGISMDVREIDGASNRGIDEIRELRENVKFAPVTSKYKVYIIDEVHMLTREAFNALLKTLEEPPRHVIFIFATTENSKVPATILSRCQCYDFRRISLAQIAANLGGLAAAEGIAISETALSWIAEAGDGSMRDAQSIFDQIISYSGLSISDEDVEDILGRADRKYLYRLSEAVIGRDAGACLMIIEEAYLAGVDMTHFYSMLLRHFRNLLLVKIADDGGSSFDIAPDQVEKIKAQIQNVSRETLQRYLDILLGEADSLRRSQETRMKIETLLVRLAYLRPVLPVGEILSALEAMEKRLHNAGTAAKVQDEAEPKVEDASGGREGQRSPRTPGPYIQAPAIQPAADLKAFVKKENPPLGAKIDRAESIEMANDCLTMCFPCNYVFLDSLMEKQQKEELERIAGRYYNCKVSLKFTTSEASKPDAANGASAGRTNSFNEIKREAMNSPHFKKVLSEFEGAELIDIKPITDKKQGGVKVQNIGNIMKQAKKMQERMARIQQELETKTVEAQAGGGMVQVVVNGRFELVSIKIEKEVVNPDDIEMLQDLVAAAVNEGIRKAQEMASTEMAKITGGLSIPGLGSFLGSPMKAYAQPIKRLINELAKLPGIGEKTAARLANYILRATPADVEKLAESLVEVKRKIRLCRICLNPSEEEVCHICSDSARDRQVICVVEEPDAVAAIEESGSFLGTYHVLHGALAPLDGIGPENLRLAELQKRLQENSIKELILATNPNVNGEATALLITRMLKDTDIVITRIAMGVPMGGDLKYVDKMTISKSLEFRRNM